MQELLFLSHRLPYPPNKGDKIRSYHVLRYLSQRYRVHLGCFIDDASDWQYIDKVKALCAGGTCFVKQQPLAARLRSLGGLLTQDALSLPYYRDRELQRWVKRTLASRPIRTAYVFSSPMAQYLEHLEHNPGALHRVIDFVDVDSEKWRQYAGTRRWPLAPLFQREAGHLLAYERSIAQHFEGATFVSRAEADLFKALAPESEHKVQFFNNGVDADYFSPQMLHLNPYPASGAALVFTGAMDYWPNIEAVQWFAEHVLPRLRARSPQLHFFIVGARPSARVKELARLPGVHVTGSVPDVRPYLAHAAVAVAPLRIARGVQNKVLEAMAMQKIVVASPQAVEGLSALPGVELLVAGDADQFVLHLTRLLAVRPQRSMGLAARARVLADYDWTNNLARLGTILGARAGACLDSVA